jgi:hypothetical protein
MFQSCEAHAEDNVDHWVAAVAEMLSSLKAEAHTRHSIPYDMVILSLQNLCFSQDA